MKVFLHMLIVTFLLTGCSAKNYSIVSGEYGWNKKGKNGEASSQYSSETMYKINTKTGDSWRMTFNTNKGYYWEAISHQNEESADK